MITDKITKSVTPYSVDRRMRRLAELNIRAKMLILLHKSREAALEICCMRKSALPEQREK